MTMVATTRPMNARSTGFFSALFSAISSWNDARVTRSALSRLSDRELDDIGLCRGDIDLIANRF
ncbi:MAG: DUF1127 domain-containing protein [Paracoccaceae bacterium]